MINEKKLSFNKILNGTLGFTLLLNSACTSRWNQHSELEGNSIADKIHVIQPQERPLPANSPLVKADLHKLEYFLLNTGFPTKTKVDIIQEYITFLSETLHVPRMQVVRSIEDYFQVPTEGEILEKLTAAKTALLDLQANIASQAGIPTRTGLSTNFNFDFLSDSEEITRLRTKNFYQQMRLELAVQKAQKNNGVVFKALDEHAQKLASDTMASLAASQLKDAQDKIKWMSTLREKEARIESLKYAAELASQVAQSSENEKKAMTAYFYEEIQKGIKDPEKFNNDLLLKVNDAKTQNAAAGFSKIAGILAKYSEEKRDLLLDISGQLNRFSSDGIIKIDLTDITKNPAFKKQADEFGKKVSGYVDDGQQLLNIAKGLGVDSEICDKAQQGLDLAGKGVQLVKAFASSNPIAIIGAVSSVFGAGSVFGGAGSTQQEIEMKQMQAKMDLMITLQNRTLDEIQKTRQDLAELRKSMADTQKLIGELSVQIADANKVLFEELESVSGVVKQVRDLVQSSLRQDSSACISIETKEKRPVEYILDSDRFNELSLDKCMSSMASLELSLKPSLDIYKSIKKESDGDMYSRAIITANHAKLEFRTIAYSLNPINSVASFFHDMSDRNIQINETSQKLVQFVVKENYRPDDFLDAQYLTAYTSAALKLAPYLSAYSIGIKDNIGDLVNARLGKVDNFSEPYTKLLGFLNSAIVQMTYLSGVYLVGLSNAELSVINNTTIKATDCLVDKNLSEKACFLHLNELARKNFLKAQLVKSLEESFKTVNVFLNLVDDNPDKTVANLKSSLDTAVDANGARIWDFKNENGKVTAKVGMDRVEIPTKSEILAAKFDHRNELKYLLAARANLIEVLADMKQNRIADEPIRRLLMLATVKKAL